jgi:hypothetical protein
MKAAAKQVTKLFNQGMQQYKAVAAAASIAVTGTLLASSIFAAHMAEVNAANYVPPANRITVTAPRLVASDAPAVKVAQGAAAQTQTTSLTN